VIGSVIDPGVATAPRLLHLDTGTALRIADELVNAP